MKGKREVIHLFDGEHKSKFPSYDNDRFNVTKCGYVRKNVTSDISKVTCKLCLRALRIWGVDYMMYKNDMKLCKYYDEDNEDNWCKHRDNKRHNLYHSCNKDLCPLKICNYRE